MQRLATIIAVLAVVAGAASFVPVTLAQTNGQCVSSSGSSSFSLSASYVHSDSGCEMSYTTQFPITVHHWAAHSAIQEGQDIDHRWKLIVDLTVGEYTDVVPPNFETSDFVHQHQPVTVPAGVTIRLTLRPDVSQDGWELNASSWSGDVTVYFTPGSLPTATATPTDYPSSPVGCFESDGIVSGRMTHTSGGQDWTHDYTFATWVDHGPFDLDGTGDDYTFPASIILHSTELYALSGWSVYNVGSTDIDVYNDTGRQASGIHLNPGENTRINGIPNYLYVLSATLGQFNKVRLCPPELTPTPTLTSSVTASATSTGIILPTWTPKPAITATPSATGSTTPTATGSTTPTATGSTTPTATGSPTLVSTTTSVPTYAGDCSSTVANSGRDLQCTQVALEQTIAAPQPTAIYPTVLSAVTPDAAGPMATAMELSASKEPFITFHRWSQFSTDFQQTMSQAKSQTADCSSVAAEIPGGSGGWSIPASEVGQGFCVVVDWTADARVWMRLLGTFGVTWLLFLYVRSTMRRMGDV